jgi:uncharacterized coiled-coil protein SlyX
LRAALLTGSASPKGVPGSKHEVSEERTSLELLGARVATLTAEVRDLQLRFGALEQRFSVMEQRFGALERRFGAQEERMTRMLALLVHLAERLDGGSPG